MSVSVQTTFLLLACIVVAGCVPIQEPPRAGYLSDYSKLKKTDNDQWLYAEGRLAGYRKFHIEPIALLLKQDNDNPVFSREELDDLKSHLTDALTKRLSEDGRYAVVAEPGPGVATFRIGITDVHATIGALNIALATKITGAGLGGIAAEGEVVDAQSGEQLAAAIRWGSGSRVLRAGFTRLGDAKLVLDRWAKDIREGIDRANASAN